MTLQFAHSYSHSLTPMEALGFPSLNTHTISYSSFQKRKPTKLPYETNHFSSSSSKPKGPSYRFHHFIRVLQECKLTTKNWS
ncbi:hypothetical protein ABKV19_027182 [Rosa sericea]